MNYRERQLGRTAAFLLPSLKLKEPPHGRSSPEQRLHEFLMEHFGGYTAQAGNIFGYWREENGRDSYGEHREFNVALTDESKLPLLKEFLSRLCEELTEECIYLQADGVAWLIYAPEKNSR